MFDTRALLQNLDRDMKKNRALYAAEKRMLAREIRNEQNEVFFLAIEPEDEKRLLVIPVFRKMGNVNPKNFPLCKGTKVERVLFDKIGPFSNQNCIIVSQTNSDNVTFEAFLISLLEDLWSCGSHEVFLTAQRTLQKWHDFFSKAGEEGLSPEQRRGLYGELHVMRGLLEQGVNPALVTHWQGPYKEDIDFIVEGLGIEVKTTQSQNPLKVSISSEYQLTSKDVNKLILAVLSLKASRNNGESLDEIIEEITKILSSWPMYVKAFRDALLSGGYHKIQNELYQGEKYIVLEKIYFNVDNAFPRLTPLHLPKGIVNVRYDVILDGLQEKIVLESKIIGMIQEL